MRILGLLIVALGLMLPASASAWRQSRTCINDIAPAPTGAPRCEGSQRPQLLSWPDRVVPFRVNEKGSVDIPGDDGISPELLDTIIASFETWNEPDCSEFRFEYDGTTSVDEYVRDDGMNVVVFQDEQWIYGSTVLAVTTVTADENGFLTNADMELNGVEHTFGLLDAAGEDDWDVQNTVTHEAGHILGLEHDAVIGSTMEFDAKAGEINKRDLHPDDIEGLCAIYPLTDDEPDDPGKNDKGCCGVTSPRSPSPIVLLLFAAVALRRSRKLNPR